VTIKPLCSISKFPPNGWIYREMIGNRYWTVPDPMLPFWDVVSSIINARANNPGAGLTTDQQAVATALAAYTCNRLNGDTRWCEGAASTTGTGQSKRSGCGGCGGKRKKK